MNQFTLAGENGRLRVAFETCPAESPSCRATVEIEVPGYRAEGKVWLSRAALGPSPPNCGPVIDRWMAWPD